MNYRQARLKFRLEQVFIYPLILLGQIIGRLFPLNSKSQHFLFFASDAIGGATKVNIDIVSLLAPHGPTIIFSKKYGNQGFADQFVQPNVRILDHRKLIDNKALYFVNIIYRGMLAAWINKAQPKVVFGGESLFFYKVIPYLDRHIKVVELSHLPTWLNYTQAFVKYIDLRVVSTPKLKRNIERQYAENGIPSHFLQRLQFIDNWVEVPPYEPKANSALKVLFVGRGAPQKRVHLVSRIAEAVWQHTSDIHFTFVGDVTTLLSQNVQARATLHEFINDSKQLQALYSSSDLLILTSAYEGLPIVVMDMMVRGKVVLSTAVDGIPDYIEHKKTGLLIEEISDEDEIVREGTRLILEMNNDRTSLNEIGRQAYLFARERFLKEIFENNYRNVLEINSAVK